MKFFVSKVKLPSVVNSLLAVASAILLTLAFPNFDLWFLAWFALVPLFFAVEREKESIVKSFFLGWIFGTLFFAGSCWWLTFAFTHYGGIPTWLAYILLLMITGIVGLFPAIFAAAFSVILKRFGTYGILSAPFLWTAQEFLRGTLADTSWNAIGYSQAFSESVKYASIGGIYLVGFLVVFNNAFVFWLHRYLQKNFGFGLLTLQFPLLLFRRKELAQQIATQKQQFIIVALFCLPFLLALFNGFLPLGKNSASISSAINSKKSAVVVIQANVPMSGLNEEKWLKLRQRHVELAEESIQKLDAQRIDKTQPLTVIFPESPMNFSYGEDAELRRYFGGFARKHNASVLFNSAEPNPNGDNYFNSAIMINSQGAKIGQYDKIHLVPFGEFAPVPSPIKPLIPTLVGSFQPGENYNLFPIGDAKAGVMICYESHFPALSREFAKRGADVLIEMTNDGYLGDTGVLRQHLAGAIFRAVETNRPVLRATNVGITAYINERGEVSDAADVYTEATRVWTVSKSDGQQTFYVKYGDWFAWLCLFVSSGLLIFSFWKKKNLAAALRR